MQMIFYLYDLRKNSYKRSLAVYYSEMIACHFFITELQRIVAFVISYHSMICAYILSTPFYVKIV